MSNYPPKMAVVICDFVIVDGEQHSGDSSRFVFLNAFAILKIERIGRGFRFEEIRQLDETSTGGGDLLMSLAAEIDDDTSLAGYRLDQMVGSLVRVPCGDVRDADCKPALLKLQAALANEVHDAFWFDRDRHRGLEDFARDFDLPAEWHRKSRQVNPNMLEREVSARAQTVWLSIAHELLTSVELRRAAADYDHWRTANAIA
jgi:hypothetical protein